MGLKWHNPRQAFAKMGQILGIKRIRLGSLEPAQLDESF